MSRHDDIAQNAWRATLGFHAGTPEKRFKYMLEFLQCNDIGSESDDDQAGIISACRRRVGLRTKVAE